MESIGKVFQLTINPVCLYSLYSKKSFLKHNVIFPNV